MANDYFQFKQFTIVQDKSAFKVGTDGVLLGAYAFVRGAKVVLDVGTGTGLIAIMSAQRSNSNVIAIEPDRESFEQACENAERSPFKDRISIIHSDLQSFDPGVKFDLILSNPPFFSDSIRNPDPRKSTARHNDSLSSEDLLENTSRLLSENGKLQIILPYREGSIFIADAAEYGFYCHDILKIKPLPDSEIKRLILTFGRDRVIPAEKFLTIEKGKRHDFSEDYMSLTKDFYLKF